MKSQLIVGLIMLASLFLVAMLNPKSIQPQVSTQTPATPIPNGTPVGNTQNTDLENIVFELKTTQTQYVEALKESNERYRFLVTGLGGLAAILTSIVLAGGIFQAFITSTQLRRESTRELRQADREKEQDQVQHRAAQQVSDIMDVVKNTLESRLDAEKEAREEATKSREQLETLRMEVRSLEIFLKNFQKNIQNARKAIEDDALKLTQTPRHEFKPIANDLAAFARQFDAFNTEYEQLEAETEPRPKFSTKALYIRGIAAHYSNQPEIAKRHLVGVLELRQPELDDTDKAYKRRLANAYYYLGITESNFGNIQTAIDSFEQANDLDPDGTDFLTKVVSAEAYVMSSVDEFPKAQHIINEVENGLHKKRDREGRLAGVYLRLQSRAFLIQANMAFLGYEENWEKESERLLLLIRNEDPAYYYATYTLAQIYALQNKHGDAKRFFQEAYETIERSGDLFITTEARSLILMRMVAGLCCRQGLMDEKKSDDHLDKADSLRNILPKIDSQICTVFSPLSKFNERSETIHDHIELIRKGEILIERRTRVNKNSS